MHFLGINNSPLHQFVHFCDEKNHFHVLSLSSLCYAVITTLVQFQPQSTSTLFDLISYNKETMQQWLWCAGWSLSTSGMAMRIHFCDKKNHFYDLSLKRSSLCYAVITSGPIPAPIHIHILWFYIMQQGNKCNSDCLYAGWSVIHILWHPCFQLDWRDGSGGEDGGRDEEEAAVLLLEEQVIIPPTLPSPSLPSPSSPWDGRTGSSTSCRTTSLYPMYQGHLPGLVRPSA